MANVTGTFTAFDQVGKKEDISNIISNIAPTKTPFQTMIGNEAVWNILYQWQEDTLFAPAANAQAEGFTAVAAVTAQTVLRSNTTQILTKTAQVSGSTTAIKTYGRTNELAYQLGMRAMELKRDLEFAYVGSGAVGNGALADGTARIMNGYQQMVTLTGTNAPVVLNGVTATAAGVASGTSTANTGAGNPLSEAMVVSIAQQLYINGTDPSVLMVKPADSLKIAAFATNTGTGRSRYIQGGAKEVVNVVDTYVTPFGELKQVLNRFLRSNLQTGTTGDALVFEPDMWKKVTLRSWTRENLAIVGDYKPVMIVGEFGLKHVNFAASGLILGLAP